LPSSSGPALVPNALPGLVDTLRVTSMLAAREESHCFGNRGRVESSVNCFSGACQWSSTGKLLRKKGLVK
jgi:hypothetical protein